MLKVEMIPDLSYRIETVAKREHMAVWKQLLRPGLQNKELKRNWKSSGSSLYLQLAAGLVAIALL